VDVFGVAGADHDCEVVGCVLDDMRDLAVALHLAEGARAGFVDIRLDLNGQVAEGDGVVGCDLPTKNAGRQGFIEDVPFQFRVFALEYRNKLREDKKLIAADEQHQACIGGIAMKIRHVVDIGNVEDVSGICGGIVCSLAPRRHGLGRGAKSAAEEQKQSTEFLCEMHVMSTFLRITR